MTEDATELISCSFCQKSQRQVKKIIAGPGVWICDECISLCNEIMAEEVSEKDGRSGDDADIPQPKARDVYDGLARTVVGQHNALRLISLAVFRHFQRIILRNECGLIADNTNLLLIGPTGTGKTLIAKTLAELLSIPIAITDATTLTEAGYVGEDVDVLMRSLIRAAEGSVKRAELGIVFIDEVDKLARKSRQNMSITRDVGGEGVQQALLTMMSGSRLSIDPSSGRKNPNTEREVIDTAGILFICAGSFQGLEPITKAREATPIGGNGHSLTSQAVITPSRVTQADLEQYGLIPEFAGRFTTIAELRALDSDDFESLLRSSDRSALREYELLFDRLNVELSLSDGALSAIAQAAVRERSGARGLRRVIDRVLSDPLFVASDRPSVSKCVVDEAAVAGEESPKLFDEKGVPINLRRNRVFLSYSRADQAALNELQIVMAPLVRRKTIDVWFDGDIKPSQKWREEVRTAMASTKVAVLLVSPNFLASRFVVEEELPYFLKVADEEDVKIVWLLLSSCLYEETELRDYQAAHNISRPLDTLSDAERRAVWVEICKNIKLAAEMNSI